MHGVRLHAHAGLSGRGVQRQPTLAARSPPTSPAMSRAISSAAWSRPRIADHLGLASNFYFFAVLNLAGAVLVYFTVAQAAPMEQTEPAARSPFAAWLDAPAQSATARGLRHRLLHPVRLHRHLYLRQFRPGAPAPVARPDAARLRLFRVPALGRDDAVGRPARSSLRNAADIVGLAGAGRGRLAAASAAQSRRGLAGHGADRGRDILCPGDRDRLREPSRNRGPRLGQRHLSRLLLRRRPGRHRRSSVRSSTGLGGRPASAELRCRSAPPRFSLLA